MSISIVIPNYNGARLLQQHLPSVIAACSPDDEIIVVDDASTDNSLEVLRQNFSQVKVVSLKKNMRFAKACNAGVSKAIHELVFLVNTDVSPLPDTLKSLEKELEDLSVFAVGCKEFAGTVVSGRNCASIQRGMFVHAAHPLQESGHTAWASGGSMAFRKKYWHELGGMDSLFRPAYYEDIDLSYRAWKKGLRILFSDKAVVKHEHESTNAAAFGKWKMQVISHKNSFLFFWKNIRYAKYWLQHCCWLPYHLVIGSLRTQGTLILGFLAALFQILELFSRKRNAPTIRTDADVMEFIQCG